MVKKNPLPLPDLVLKHHSADLYPLLDQWLSQKKVAPVQLMTGPAGVGKREVVYFLSQWLLCQNNDLSDQDAENDLFGQPATLSTDKDIHQPCDKCSSCQKALSGNWIDFCEIASDSEDSDSNSIKIDQLRELRSSLGFAAYESRFKIVLIRDAEKMTVQAANSLLKIMEEPPPGWMFFLTASDPSLLLPTLVSRCQILRLKPLPSKVIEELIHQIDPKRAKISARLANGSWSKAISICDEVFWEKRSAVFRFLQNPASELGALVDWAASDLKNLLLLIDHLEQVLEDLINWTLNNEKEEPCQTLPFINEDYANVLDTFAQSSIAKMGSRENLKAFLIERAERIFRARSEIQAPLNKKIVVQDILLPWV